MNEQAVTLMMKQLDFPAINFFDTALTFCPTTLLPEEGSQLTRLESLWELSNEQKLRYTDLMAKKQQPRLNGACKGINIAHVKFNFQRLSRSDKLQGLWLYLREANVHLLLTCSLPSLDTECDRLDVNLYPKEDSSAVVILSHRKHHDDHTSQNHYRAFIQLPEKALNDDIHLSVPISEKAFDIKADPKHDTPKRIQRDLEKRLMHYHYYHLSGSETFSSYFEIETVNSDDEKERYQAICTHPFLYVLTKDEKN